MLNLLLVIGLLVGAESVHGLAAQIVPAAVQGSATVTAQRRVFNLTPANLRVVLDVEIVDASGEKGSASCGGRDERDGGGTHTCTSVERSLELKRATLPSPSAAILAASSRLRASVLHELKRARVSFERRATSITCKLTTSPCTASPTSSP